MDSQPGTLGRFHLIRQLGRGGFGEVWLAQDPRLGKDVALKILHQGLAADVKFIQEAQREARLVSTLSHPNLVKIHEAGEVNGRVYIEMDYVDGKSLAQWLQDGRNFSFQQSLAVLQQIADALDATHQKKIIHRDVKPENILLDQHGKAFLVDFGLAHAALTSLGPSSDLVGLGTAMYMSPEQAAGRSGDQTTDVYSLGVIAYRLFTGQLPFQEKTFMGYIKAHGEQKPPDPCQLNPAISTDLRKVLLKALEKDPTKRYKRAGDFSRALAKALSRPFRKPKPVLATCFTLGLLGLLVVGAAGAYLWLAPPPWAEALIERFSPGVEAPLPAAEAPAEMLPAAPAAPVASAGEANASISPVVPAVLPTIPPAQPSVSSQGAQPLPSATPASNPAAAAVLPAFADDLEALLGSGVVIQTQPGSGIGSGQGRLVFQARDGSGAPLVDLYVTVSTQKKDLAGSWVVDKRVDTEYTDNTGQAGFDLAPGNYIISVDFRGYNWGNAGDVKGQADVPVQAGQITQLQASFGRLKVGFLRGDGSIINDQYISIYTQKKDLAGKWVRDEQVDTEYTDNSGTAFFNLAPGLYIVASEFRGYNWGSAGDVQGMSSVVLLPGQETPLIISLGQVAVGLLRADGQPRVDQYVEVFLQSTDITGKPVLGDRVDSEYTDNTGQAIFNLTPGMYVIKVDDQILFNVPVESGRITQTNGDEYR